jgi:hypothetical protein
METRSDVSGVWPVGLGLHFTRGGCWHFGEIRVSEVVGCKVSLNSVWVGLKSGVPFIVVLPHPGFWWTARCFEVWGRDMWCYVLHSEVAPRYESGPPICRSK